MPENEQKVFYRPEIEYDRTYYSEIESKNPQTVEQSEVINTNVSNPAKNIKNKFNSIKSKYESLPENLKSLLKPQLIGSEFLLNYIDDDLNYLKPEQEIIVTEQVEIEPEDLDPDDPFYTTISTHTNVDIIRMSKQEYITKSFQFDMATILDDYFDKLNEKMDGFLLHHLQLLLASGLSQEIVESKFLEYSSNLQNKNDVYLSDFIHKSQIVRDQKERLHKKIYDSDSMVINIKACQIAKESLLRYDNEQKINLNTYEDVASKSIYDASIAQSQKKYKETFRNLYKYFNSSVISIGECFNMQLNEEYAKLSIYKKEGII